MGTGDVRVIGPALRAAVQCLAMRLDATVHSKVHARIALQFGLAVADPHVLCLCDGLCLDRVRNTTPTSPAGADERFRVNARRRHP